MEFINPAKFFFQFVSLILGAIPIFIVLILLNLLVGVGWYFAASDVELGDALACTFLSLVNAIPNEVDLPLFVEIFSEVSGLISFGIVVAAAIEALK